MVYVDELQPILGSEQLSSLAAVMCAGSGPLGALWRRDGLESFACRCELVRLYRAHAPQLLPEGCQ